MPNSAEVPEKATFEHSVPFNLSHVAFLVSKCAREVTAWKGNTRLELRVKK